MSGMEVQVSDHDQLWTAVAQLLRAQVSEAVWFSTFQDVTALDSDPSMLRVGAPNGHTRDRILSRYLPLVRDALEEIGAANRHTSSSSLPSIVGALGANAARAVVAVTSARDPLLGAGMGRGVLFVSTC